MKCKLLAAAIAVCALAACSEAMIVDEKTSSEDMVSLKIDINHEATKVNWTNGESSLWNVQIFIFRDEDKKLEAYEKASLFTFDLNLTRGKKLIYVVMNAPDITDVFTFDELCARSTLYKDNTLEQYIMEGYQTVSLESAGATVTVDMNRVMSKISFVDIKNDLKGAYAGQTITLKNAYLINVAGDRKMFAAGENIPVPTIWFHKRGYNEGDGIKDMAFVDYESAEVLHTKSYTARQDYYCYPNSTAKDSSDATVTTDEDFVPRYTRLVLEAEIKGTLYYYPVSVPNIESNKNYEVSLTITRLGSSHPDIPFYSEDQGFKINIKSWDVKTIGETI